MEQEYNRIEADYKKWQAKETRIEKLVPGTLENNRPFLREKLRFLENLQVRYRAGLSEEERLMLRVIQSQRDDLASKLYPNPIVRLLRNLVSAVVLERKSKTYRVVLVENTRQLRSQLARLGFGEATAAMERNIQQGKPGFSVPVSFYPKENERLDYDLKFGQREAGGYQFLSYGATLTNTETKEKRSQSFTAGQPFKFNHTEMANLLIGRAVLVQESDVPWNNQKWVQLHLNDKDAQGNYRVKEKQSEGFDALALIKSAGIRQKHTGMDDELMLQTLKQGNCIALNVLRQGVPQTFKLELDPFKKGINLYDSRNKKVAIDEVLKKTGAQTRVVIFRSQRPSGSYHSRQGKGIN